jgi:hypothetical protein
LLTLLAMSSHWASPDEVEHWSLTTLREKLVKIGNRIVRHGRYVMLQLAEIAQPARCGHDRPGTAQTPNGQAQGLRSRLWAASWPAPRESDACLMRRTGA